MVGICLIFLVRLFSLQVISDEYKIKADNNSQRNETVYPARGLIYDRNGRLLVDNQAAYDLMILPRQVKAFDTTELITILGITREYLENRLEECKRHSRFKRSVLISQITGERFAVLQEKLFRYPGFSMQTRTLRKYNVNHSGALFGYISEVNMQDIERDKYYSRGDYIGATGLERTFEYLLRGQKGKKIVLVDNFGREQGAFADGAYDEQAQVGEDLYVTLDIDLQEYAIYLMQNKRGGVVAIEPATGEILAKVSVPGYDPQLMIGLERSKNYQMLNRDTLNKPLYDRTTLATYSPGSIFKTIMALIGLETKVVTQHTQFGCVGGATVGRLIKCHNHKSPVNLVEAITHSCNPYFANVFHRVLERSEYGGIGAGYEAWRNYVTAFGLGSRVSVDFVEDSGLVPSRQYYDRLFKTTRWHASYVNSLSIGQGELSITQLQMANIAAALANRGYYFTPHIARPTHPSLQERIVRHDIPISRAHFEPVIEGMKRVISEGTGRRALVDSVVVAGKTGTVQNNFGDDHSVFMAFAPADNPRIALVVYVENGGWGSSFAAPIAGLLIEKYLKGTISEAKKPLEEEMIKGNLLTR